MCGIAGFQGDFSDGLLERMNRALAHRGPDDRDSYLDRDSATGLTHVRLSIIDLSSRGRQPMWDEAKEHALVYNGEIYNYKELRRELHKRGEILRSNSDSEVLLRLLIRKGAAALDELNGIFSFAFFSRRSKELLLARDCFGIKPLYFSELPRGFLFASELKALLEEGSLDRQVDILALHSYLTFLWCPSPHTPLRAVKKLPPGHAMLVRSGRVSRTWKYYEIPYSTKPPALPGPELEEEFGRALHTAVQRQLVSDVPIGAMLSGGLDSSAIVALARREVGKHELPCFTVRSSEEAYRQEGVAFDLSYARKVARHLDVELHDIPVAADLLERMALMLFHLEEPQGDLAPLHVLSISQLARSQGVKVLLSGCGSDDILGGYRRHIALQAERYWTWLPACLRRGLETAARRLPQKTATLRRVRKALAHAGMSPDQRLLHYFVWLPGERARLLIHPERESEAGAPLDALSNALGQIPSPVPPLNQMLFLDTKFFQTDHNLNYVDKMSMAAGVETRVPFLDQDLVALAARLPLEYKVRGRTGKWILRRMMRDYLPREVIFRPKAGFGVPLRTWLRNDLKEVVRDILSKESLDRRKIFNTRAVEQLLDDHQSGRIDAAYPILVLACTEIWLRVFLDGMQPSTLVSAQAGERVGLAGSPASR